jgi:hypothetical protein
MLLRLPLALLSASASYLEQTDHCAFRYICRRIRDATEAYGAGPVHITLRPRSGVWTQSRTYMQPRSVSCNLPHVSGANEMVKLIASLGTTVECLNMTCLQGIGDMSSLVVLRNLTELSLTETYGVRGLLQLVSLKFPRLHTLRLHGWSVVLTSGAGTNLDVLRTLDVSTHEPFLFAGVWPCLETIRLARPNTNYNHAIDIAGCPRLTRLDESQNAQVDLHAYGATFLQPNDRVYQSPLPPATKTLVLGRYCDFVTVPC